MDTILNLSDEASPPDPEEAKPRILKKGDVLVDKQYIDKVWLTKLKLAPEISVNLPAGGTVGLGEIAGEQQLQQVATFPKGSKAVETYCTESSSREPGTALALQRDPVATYLTNAIPSMDSINLTNAQRNPILLKRDLHHPAPIHVTCKAVVSAWQLAPKHFYDLKDASKVEKLEKHVTSIVKGKRRKGSSVTLNMTEHTKWIRAELSPALAAPATP